MNENTTKLIEQLAAKMGTTSQYLWSILVRQAPIESTIALVQYLLVGIACFGLYKLHRRFLKPINSEYEETFYDKYEELAMTAMVTAAIALIVLVIICFAYLPDVINGYLNPEYWALNHVLEQLKK